MKALKSWQAAAPLVAASPRLRWICNPRLALIMWLWLACSRASRTQIEPNIPTTQRLCCTTQPYGMKPNPRIPPNPTQTKQ